MIEEQPGSALSRRSLVKVTATAAVIGGGLALAGPAGTADAATSGEHVPATRAAAHDDRERRGGQAGVLVRVLDARLGTLEVYTPAGHRTVTDPALAAQLDRLGR